MGSLAVQIARLKRSFHDGRRNDGWRQNFSSRERYARAGGVSTSSLRRQPIRETKRRTALSVDTGVEAR